MSEGIDLDLLRRVVADGKIQWHQHALVRCMERDISRLEVIRAILHGERIEDYPNDFPHASCLLLRIEANRPPHVVASADPGSDIAHIITAYRPDAMHFELDWKTRRKKS